MNRAQGIVLALALLVLAGCASVPNDPRARAEFEANHDPLEPLNRRVFAFNEAVDGALIRPVAEAYVHVLPAAARDGLRRCLDNLNEPLVLANCLLQARWRDAAATAGRFALNSTAGLGGWDDVAVDLKLERQTGDFGQTLSAWGAGEGPYLVIPVFGPSGFRDGIGRGADIFLDPWWYVPAHPSLPGTITVGRLVADGIDQRARNLDSLRELKRQSIDYYAALRSLYRQNRAAEIRGQHAPSTLPPANFYDDPGR